MSPTKTKKPANGMVQLNANVPSDLKKAIQKLAVDLDMSMSDLVADILFSYVNTRANNPSITGAELSQLGKKNSNQG